MKHWVALHRWLGWVLSPLLSISALSGAILLWMQPWPAAGGTPGPYGPLAGAIDQGLAALSSQRPDLVLDYIDLPRSPGATVHVRLVPRQGRGTGSWAELDADSGAVRDLRADGSNAEAWLFNLHHEWWLGDAGSWPVGAIGLLGLFTLVIALRLWLRMRGTRAPTAWRRWHRRIGIVALLPLAAIFLTGLALSWPDLVRRPLALLTGEARPAPPQARHDHAHAATAVTPGQALNVAVQHLPQAQPTRLYAARAGSLRVRMRADEWHPNGLTNVYVSTDDGSVLRAVGWRELPLSVTYANVIYPLHIGWLPGSPARGGAVLVRCAWTLVALGLAWMVVSGLPWQRRTSARPSSAAVARRRLHP